MAELPDHVALLWGRREAPRRGPKAALTVEEIVKAAIALADAEGLAAVSMARVAAELGNSTMALYRHVRNKDELLVLMADTAMEPPPPPPPGVDWRTGLTTWALGIVETIGRHPWHAQLTVSGPPIAPNGAIWFDRGLAALADTGLTEAEKVGVVQSLSTFIQGQIRIAQDLGASFARDPDTFGRYGEVLAEVLDAARYPALTRTIAAGVFEPEGMAVDDLADDFRFALDLFLDGLAALIARRA